MITDPPPIDWHDTEADQAPPVEEHTRPAPPAGPIAPTSDTTCQERRAQVLQHPEIAERLTKPPIRYARPEQWNGYIPPELWREVHNDSPQRKALLEIVAAAVQADKEQTHG